MINSITENVFIIFLKIPGGGGGGYNILAISSGILYFFLHTLPGPGCLICLVLMSILYKKIK